MLIALAALVAGLLLTAAVAWVRPHAAGLAMAGLCIAAVLLGLAAIVAGGRTALVLPAGLPGARLTLALDPLAAFFLLPLGVAGAAAGLGAARGGPLMPILAPVFAAAMLFTVLAGDGLALALGFAVLSAAGWGLAGGAGLLALTAAGPACLLAALSLGAPDAGFEAMRAAPPDGWRAAAVLTLTVLAAGAPLGPAPLWRGGGGAQDDGAAALLSGGFTRVGAYILARVLLDLCGPATPAWWGAPLLALGASAAILGGVRGNRGATMGEVLAGMAMQNAGLIAIGLGMALAARGSDLPALAALALGGAMLHALNHGVAQTLATACVDAAGRAAGTGALDRLGGLARAMPVTGACLLVAASSLATLPLSAGFAGFWLLLQAVIGGPRLGGLAAQSGFALVAAAMALAAALGAAAMVRLTGIGFLGRPRSPRAAAAEDPGRLLRGALCGLAGLAVLLGLFPGAALALTAGARRVLSAAGAQAGTDWLGIAPAADLPGYAPLGLALLIGLVALGGWLVVRRLPPPLDAPAWDGGFAPAPPWLPFGDPATQIGAAALAAPVLEVLGGAERWAWPAAMPWAGRATAWLSRAPTSVRPRLALAVLLALAVAGLVAASWLAGA